MNIYCCLARQMELLKILINKGQWVSSLELASALNTTNRIIEIDVEILNYALEQYSSFIIFKKGKGYKLESNNISLLMLVLSCSENKNIDCRNQRINKILARLLISNYSLELSSLEKEFSISRETLEQDLKHIQKMLNNFYPSLELILSYQCVGIMGSEFPIRYLMTELLMTDFNLEDMLFSEGDRFIKKQLFDSTLEKATQIFNEERISIAQKDIVILATYLEVTRLRVSSDNKISFLESKLQPCPDYYCSLARRLYEIILPLPLNDRDKCLEISQIALQISFIDLLQASSTIAQSTSDITYSGTDDIVLSLLDTLRSEFFLDFHPNEALYDSLTMHTKAFISRIKYQQITPNLALETVKINYAFIHRLSKYIHEAFHNTQKIKLSECEASYAAMHLANALENLRLD